MDSNPVIQSETDLGSAFEEQTGTPSIWHRIHVGLDGVHEGVAHVIGDVAGAAAGIGGFIYDGGDWITETAFNYDLYEGSSAGVDWFLVAKNWTKENIGEQVAYFIVPPAAIVDAFAGKAKILDETDQTIYSTVETGTRIAGDAAVVAGAVVGVVILSGGTAAGALTTVAGAGKTAITATTGAAIKYPLLAIVADQVLTDGYGARGIFIGAKKIAEATGRETAAKTFDTIADWAGPDSHDSPNDPDTDLRDIVRVATGGEETPPNPDEKSWVEEFSQSVSAYIPGGNTLTSTFNWLGGGSLWSTLAIGITTLLGGNWLLDRIMGNSFLSGILSIGLAAVATYVLPRIFRDAAKGDSPDITTDNETDPAKVSPTLATPEPSPAT